MIRLTLGEGASRSTAVPVRVNPRADVNEAIEALQRATEAHVDLLSISGGWDSRVVLAAMLANGRRPSLLVSGDEASFDHAAARELALALTLPLKSVTIDATAIIATAQRAAVASNGLLPITHWAGLAHMALHAQGKTVAMGLNGELVRRYYRDRRRVTSRSHAIDAVIAAQQSSFAASEIEGLAPALSVSLAEVRSRVDRCMSRVTVDGGLDRFFHDQYAVNKTGADVAALSAFAVDVMTPFADPRWTSIALRLPRWWHLANRFHRKAVVSLYPNLPLPQSEAVSEAGHYLDQGMFLDPVLLGLLRSRAELLADLVAPGVISALIDDFLAGRGRPHLVFAMMSLALFVESHH